MNKPALTAAVKLLVDGAKDAVAALQPGQNLAGRIADFENLIPDAMTSVQSISDLPAEVAALQPQDYADLATETITDAAFSSAHAQAISQAAVKLIADGAAGAPDVINFLAAVKNPPSA